MKKKTLIIASAVASAALFSTGPPASAGTGDYLTRVGQEMPYVLSEYGSTAMVREGCKICADEAAGITGASDLADLIVAEMPMSRSMSIELQVLAEVHLGCWVGSSASELRKSLVGTLALPTGRPVPLVSMRASPTTNCRTRWSDRPGRRAQHGRAFPARQRRAVSPGVGVQCPLQER